LQNKMKNQDIIAVWEAQKFRTTEAKGYIGDYSEIQKWMENNCTFFLTREIPEMGISSRDYYFGKVQGVIVSNRFSDAWKDRFPIVPIYLHCYGMKLPRELASKLESIPETMGVEK